MLTLCLAEQDDTSKVGSSQAKNWSQVVILDSRWHYHVCPYSLCRYSFPLKTQVLKHLYPSFLSYPVYSPLTLLSELAFNDVSL